jgi:5-amino-6-(5-phosphoribosylamino)uracil reductase
LRLHGSTCLIHAPDLLESRRLRGLDPQPLALAVSRSGQLPGDLPFFRQPLQRWLLAPGCSGDQDASLPPAGFARQLAFDDWRALLTQLARQGLGRLVLLGGARLAASLLAEDLVEELQLTLCPRLLGGGHTWLPGGDLLPPAGPWQLIESRGLGDGELLLRYRRGAQGAGFRPPV